MTISVLMSWFYRTKEDKIKTSAFNKSIFNEWHLPPMIDWLIDCPHLCYQFHDIGGAAGGAGLEFRHDTVDGFTQRCLVEEQLQVEVTEKFRFGGEASIAPLLNHRHFFHRHYKLQYVNTNCVQKTILSNTNWFDWIRLEWNFSLHIGKNNQIYSGHL